MSEGRPDSARFKAPHDESAVGASAQQRARRVKRAAEHVGCVALLLAARARHAREEGGERG
eukprot:6174926-Pleurochrysis_carterae.AAC.2